MYEEKNSNRRPQVMGNRTRRVARRKEYVRYFMGLGHTRAVAIVMAKKETLV